MTWDEAVSTLTGPGCPFEITTQEVMGLPTKVLFAYSEFAS